MVLLQGRDALKVTPDHPIDFIVTSFRTSLGPATTALAPGALQNPIETELEKIYFGVHNSTWNAEPDQLR